MISGDRAAVVGDHGRAARHGFDHDETERLRPVDRKQQPDRAAEEIRFFGVADLADIFDQTDAVDQRADEFIVVFLVGPVDLGRDLERNAASDRDLDRPIDAFFRRDPAQYREISRA